MSSSKLEGFIKTTNSTSQSTITRYFCNYVLYATVKESSIRILDIVLLVPNALFMVFLFFGLSKALLKFNLVHCPIVKTVFTLVFAVCITGVIKSFVSMLLRTSKREKHKNDLVIKILWLILRCLVLSVEMCVIIFALCAGKVDSKYGVRAVLLISSTCIIIFTSTQATLEFTLRKNEIYGGRYNIFEHGGMIFWFASSIVFAIVYCVIIILPFTRLRQHHIFPMKKSFYWYCGILSVLNIVQSIGSGLVVFSKEPVGICLVDITSISYFSLFGPFVYLIFLSDFLQSKTSHILTSTRHSFSYQPIPDSFLPPEEINDDLSSYAYYGSIS
ncbi:transmembrane protein adipocyte-associated 1 homolog [Actinia tenebrosa]|uniref:Transmembrane protein adipocyte-associated 1 homolog n=1 Tax=Actinia tenebrosa TaxID=6105 RepID=A0A6P8I7F4_ACTTE|nr:transmembrane protein adipocyte-associated 1 homolog [Actinia tenebrosa]